MTFLYLVPSRQLVNVPVGDKEKDQVMRAVMEIRRVIEEKDMSGPTPVGAEPAAPRANSATIARTYGDFGKQKPFSSKLVVAKKVREISRARARFFRDFSEMLQRLQTHPR